MAIRSNLLMLISITITRKMVETFVKNVYVHDINRIEVVYVTEDIITKVIRRNNAVFDEEFAEC